jgi:hypothetical protein
MKTAYLGFAASAAALSFALPATAAETLQVVSGTTSPRAVTVSAFDPIGQTFTAFTDLVTSVGFEFTTLNSGSANTPLTLNIYAGETLTGTSLFTSTFTLPASLDMRDERAWVDIALPGLAVTRGAFYSLVLTATSSRAALLTGPGFNSSTGQFFGGDAYAGGRLLGTPQPYANCNGATNNCDANFRVTGENLVAAVPEPGTWAMLILGFGVVGGALRRRATRRPQLIYS